MICGIDIGLTGAICILDRDKILYLIEMPILKTGKKSEIDLCRIKDILCQFKPSISHAFIEKAGVRPKQGSVSMFRYGSCYGMIIGLCAGLEIPYSLIAPQTWKATMLRDMPKEKEISILRAQQLFPTIVFHRKKDHHRAEALLLAEYGRRLLHAR